jgi:hypothetical protein
MDAEDKMPRYSADLVRALSEMYELPPLPQTAQGWVNLTPSRTRELAFIAGQAAVVAMLADWFAESNAEEQDESNTGETGHDAITAEFGKVLGPDSEQHKELAPIRMAERSLEPLLDSGSDE